MEPLLSRTAIKKGYQEKKQFFEGIITLYGRRTVLALLEDPQADIFRLHLADTHAGSERMQRIENLARARQVEVRRHERIALSRISKNARQDQGVAIDVQARGYQGVEALAKTSSQDMARDRLTEVLLLDGITNPQNLGLIIRSVTASPIRGLVLPRKSCAKIDPLVYKASAGTLLRANIFHCPDVKAGLDCLQQHGFEIIGLAGHQETGHQETGHQGTGHRQNEPPTPLHHLAPATRQRAYVLGNETEGLSQTVRQRCDILARIPMSRGVDSINVAAAATLVAFQGLFTSTT